MIKNVLDKEISILKDPSRVFIGGMSQGCVMSLYTGLTSKCKLGGILGFSGFYFPYIEENEESSLTPILISHGKEDKDIPWSFAEKTY